MIRSLVASLASPRALVPRHRGGDGLIGVAAWSRARRRAEGILPVFRGAPTPQAAAIRRRGTDHLPCVEVLSLLLLCAACGGGLPARYVVEQDIGELAYRRYQKTLGVELVIEGNPGTGHTASYLRRGRERVAVATAFVTVYERARSLSAEARDWLSGLQGYRFETRELSGHHVWTLDGGPAERWVAWVSGRHLIKLGAPEGESVPDALAERYLALYPSDLDEHGRALPDAPSAGPSRAESKATGEPTPEVPRFLEKGAPR